MTTHDMRELYFCTDCKKETEHHQFFTGITCLRCDLSTPWECVADRIAEDSPLSPGAQRDGSEMTDAEKRAYRLELEEERAYSRLFPGAKLSPEEKVDHPKHYNSLGAECSKCGHPIECIDVVRHMSFTIGNAIKYLWRKDHKNGTEDLKKAKWYVEDAIKEAEK